MFFFSPFLCITDILFFVLGVTEDEVITWLQERLDLAKHLSGKKGADNMDLARAMTYRIETGVRVQVFHGWGLEGTFMLFGQINNDVTHCCWLNNCNSY